jgi:hypothetical protein
VAAQLDLGPPTTTPIEAQGVATGLFSRSEIPPEGVAAQITIGQPGAANCLTEIIGARENGETAVPTQPKLTIDAVILGGISFCWEGFNPGEDVNFELTRPDGTTITEIAKAFGNTDYGGSSIGPRLMPGDPLDGYTLTATQDDVTVQLDFSVELRSAPKILVLDKPVARGGTIQVALAGFQPDQAILLHLYRHRGCFTDYSDPCLDYISQLPPVHTDERGEAMYILDVDIDAPIDFYGIYNEAIDSHNQVDIGYFSLIPVVVHADSFPLRLDDQNWAGGYGGADDPKTYAGRTATWIYGTSTEYDTMTTAFNIPMLPEGVATLTIMGMDSEDRAKTSIDIYLNGRSIYTGPNPLPDDNLPLETGTWSTYSWTFDADLLWAGTNTLTISNLDTGAFSQSPWFMLDYAEITLDAGAN